MKMELPKLVDVSNVPEIIRSSDIIVFEAPTKNNLFIISYKNKILKFKYQGKELTFDELPESLEHLKYEIIESLIIDGETIMPLKDYVIFGKIEEGNFSIFAIQNINEDFLNRDQLEKITSDVGLKLTEIIYRGRFSYQDIINLFNQRNRYTGKNIEKLLVITDPPLKDTVDGEYQYFFGTLDGGKSQKETHNSQKEIVTEFANIFVMPQIVKEIRDFLKEEKFSDLQIKRMVPIMVLHHIYKRNRAEFDHYTDQLGLKTDKNIDKRRNTIKNAISKKVVEILDHMEVNK
jgi:hypothetical protein